MHPGWNWHLVKCYNVIFGATFERDLEKKGQLWKNKPPGEGHKALQTHKMIDQGPLKGYRVDRCWKKQTHKRIKPLQGSIIDHFTL